MDVVVSILAPAFTYIMSWPLWQRAVIILGIGIIILYFLCRIVGKVLCICAGSTIKMLYLVVWETLFTLFSHQKSFLYVEKRNRWALRHEKMYNFICSSKGIRKIFGFGSFCLIYISAVILISLPNLIGSTVSVEYDDAVYAVTNIYHIIEAPLLRQAQKADPLMNKQKFLFSDVEETHDRISIEYACFSGIMKSSAGCFYPDADITRADFATMLYQYAGQPQTSFKNRISDVNMGMIEYQAIHWCVEQGILTFIQDKHFFPEQHVTREQFIVGLYRYANTQGMLVVSDYVSSPNLCDEKIHDWAVDAYTWAIKEKIVNKAGTILLLPSNKISRECAATYFYMFNDWVRNFTLS